VQSPEQKAAWYVKNADRILAKMKARYDTDASYRNGKRAASSTHYVANKESRKEQARRASLKKFGLTPEQYSEMEKAQDGLCAICKRPPTASDPRKKRLCVDHDHETGKVRQLLCHGCNVGLGCLQDNTAILFRAIEYLNQHR
jgi:hypothetical protein